MRNRLSRGLLAALILGITFLYPLLAPPPHRIDEAHAKLIEKGMSYAEVENILGVPPGEYDWAEADAFVYWSSLVTVNYINSGTTGTFKSIMNSTLIDVSGSVTVSGSTNSIWTNGVVFMDFDGDHKSWTGRHGSISVYFDHSGHVAWPGSYRSEVRIVPPWQRAWRWWKSR